MKIAPEKFCSRKKLSSLSKVFHLLSTKFLYQLSAETVAAQEEAEEESDIAAVVDENRTK